jgi:tetratricopeptide (TPR) repeat protein
MALNLFLAGLERRERRSEARHFYEEGVALARSGQKKAAVDRFQSARAAERTNPLYQRAVATAMLEQGKVEEATVIAAERLQHQPTDAAASQLMARALVRQGKPAEAVPYYHRAIYGDWDDDAAANRVRSRFELVELLARMGSKRELLAELLPLQDEAPGDEATRRQIAYLFLDAGAPARSEEIFSDLLRQHGPSAETYAGLGDAELARGNYRSARTNFAVAAKLAPGDSAIARRLGLTQRVIALDPTQRGLGSEERYRRSVELLKLTLQGADSCLADVGATTRATTDSAKVAVARPPPQSTRRQEAVEMNMDLAERLWEMGRGACPDLAATDESVALVLERVAQ